MAPADPEPTKRPRKPRDRRPNESTTTRVPPTVVKTETEASSIAIDHLTAATARHIKALERERRQLLTDRERLRGNLEGAHSELDRLRPELATARADLRNTAGAALIASIFVAVGGAAVSAAGYFDDSPRRITLSAGVATLFCGLTLQIWLGRRSSG